MTDWLEELLEQVQDEERPEGLLNWFTAIPTAGRTETRRSGGEEKIGKQATAAPGLKVQPAVERTQPGEGEDRLPSRNGRLWEGEDRLPSRNGRLWEGEDRLPSQNGRLWEDGDRPGSQNEWLRTEELLRAGLADQSIGAARRRSAKSAEGQTQTGPRGSAAVEENGAALNRAENQRADGLYRQVVRAGRAVEAARPVGQATVVEQMSAGAPSLTVDELDRAVRRDSRRYDAGMELY